MSWTDTQANCITEVCCGKDGRQAQAMAQVLEAEAKIPKPKAQAAGLWLCANRDFTARRGTLYGPQMRVPLNDLLAQGLNAHEAQSVINWLDATVDCAPKGSLYEFKQDVARLARGSEYEA